MKKIVSLLAAVAFFTSCQKDEVALTHYVAPVDSVVVDSTQYPLKGVWKCYQYIQTVGTQTAITSVNWTIALTDTMFRKDITGVGIYDFEYKLEYLNAGNTLINIYYKPGIATPYEVTKFKLQDHYEYKLENLNASGKDFYYLRKK